MSNMTITMPVTTMTSREILDLLNSNREKPLELKELHRNIRDLFAVEIDGGQITPSLDSRGYVDYYLLPEVESKMLVASKDSSYLRLITEYWVNKSAVPRLVGVSLAKPVVTDYLELFTLFGAPLHIAQIEAVKLTKRDTGFDLSPLLLVAPAQDAITESLERLEPKELGKLVGLSAIAVNKLLESFLWQSRINGQWVATDAGNSVSTKHAWSNKSKSGYNLKWSKSAFLKKHSSI